MKILYIITQAEGGGAQKYTLSLAKYFDGAIAVGDEATKLFGDAKTLGLDVYPLKHLKRSISPWNDFLASLEIRHLVKNLDPDIVHLNSTKAGILGSFACIGLKKKVVFTAHGFVFNEPLGYAAKNFYLAAEKTASSYRDFIITVSDADRQSALDNHLIDQKKISVIHNGIGQIEFLDKIQAKTALKLPDNKIIIGTIANFYKSKGLDVLIDAIGLLSPADKEKIRLIIIGDGSERRLLESQIKNQNLENTVKLVGDVPAASRYLKAFDLFIMPSRKEGLPFALLEAMQAGLAIIATDVGGIPEALEGSGVLVKPENPRALAEAIKKLIADKNLAAQLVAKAKQRSAEFTEERMLEETQKIYRRLLSD